MKQVEYLAVAGKFVSPPIHDPHLGGSESINFPSCSARIHWRELLLEGNEVSRGINGVKEWTETIRLLQYLFSLCHLGSHYFLRNVVLQLKLSNAKWRLYFSLQHGQFDKKGARVCLKRLCPNMSYQPMWQPTSQLFSVIPATDDAAPHSLFLTSCLILLLKLMNKSVFYWTLSWDVLPYWSSFKGRLFCEC